MKQEDIDFLSYLINPFEISRITLQEANRISCSVGHVSMKYLGVDSCGTSIKVVGEPIVGAPRDEIYEAKYTCFGKERNIICMFRLYKKSLDGYFQLDVLIPN